MGLVGILVNGWHSDRTGERIGHVAVPLSLLSLGIGLAATSDGLPVLPVAVMVVGVGTFMYAHHPAFWPIPTAFLGSTAAASAIGFINMLGNLGGSVGPMVVGQAAKGQASFAPALWRLAPWPLAAATIIVVVGYTRRRHPPGPGEGPVTPPLHLPLGGGDAHARTDVADR
jgi:ACS family tartrate transporter-like MFS transporter